jgi:hypothetical protein
MVEEETIDDDYILVRLVHLVQLIHVMQCKDLKLLLVLYGKHRQILSCEFFHFLLSVSA